jgi:Gpi18-like mannosyltransferase
MQNITIIHKHKTTLFIIITVLTIKIILFIWAAYNLNLIAHHGNTWLSIWDRWDAGVYKTIASSSYNLVNIKLDYWAFLSHFPPLYPLAIASIVWLLHISLVKAGILVSTISIVAASIILYKLAYLDFRDKKAAWLSVIFLNLYPLSYFTISVYSESLFVFLVITSLYFLRKENFVISGLAAAGAILTRIIGIIFLPIYFLYPLYYLKQKGKVSFKLFLPFLFSFLAVVIYLGINKIYYGDYFYFFTEKISFNATKHLIIPFNETYPNFLAIFKDSNFKNQVFMTSLGWNSLFTIFAFVVTIIGIRKIRWEYSFYSLASILIFASLSWGISNARYTLSIFPIFIILGLIKNKILLSAILIIFILMLFYFTEIFTSGAWAF